MQRFFYYVIITFLISDLILPAARANEQRDSTEIINSDYCLAIPDSHFLSNTYSQFIGLSCNQLNKISKFKGAATSIAILSAKELLSDPVIKNQLLNGMITAGLFASANPAVALITVVGTYGISRLYFALNASIEECELQDRVQLELRIRKELNEKYNI